MKLDARTRSVYEAMLQSSGGCCIVGDWLTGDPEHSLVIAAVLCATIQPAARRVSYNQDGSISLERKVEMQTGVSWAQVSKPR